MLTDVHRSTDDRSGRRVSPVDPTVDLEVLTCDLTCLQDPSGIEDLMGQASGKSVLVVPAVPEVLDATVTACVALVDRGPASTRVAVELVVPHPVPAGLLTRFVTATGSAVRRSADLSAADELPPDVRTGWQVGVLVALLPQGLLTVRGVDPKVLRRVAEVERRIGDAR